MAFRWIPMVLALTAGLTACAAAGRGDPNTIRPITTTPVTVAASTTVTTAPPTTTSTTTTTGSTTSTQVEDPQAATKQEIAGLVVKARQAFLDAAADPVNPELPELSELYGEPILTEVRDALVELRDEPAAYRRSAADLESITPVAAELTSDVDAAVIACIVTDIVVYNPGTEEVIDDSIVALLRTYILKELDGKWLVVDIQLIDRLPGATSCQ